MKNKIIGGIIALSIILLIIIILIRQVPKTIELTTFEKAYNMVQLSDEENIEIPIYINYLDSYLVKKENISSVNINNSEESISFKIEDIINTEEITYIKNKKFFKYIFKLNPLIKIDDDFYVEMFNSSLEINYIQGVKVNIGIGSFSYYYYNFDNSALSLKQLKGLINTYDDKTLVGVLIGLKNNTNSSIKITNIIPLDINVDASLDEILEIKDFNQGVKIDDLLGYRYDLYNKSNNQALDLEIISESNYFIPLKYKDQILLDKIGFLIQFNIDGENKYLCIDDFLFFDTNLYSRKSINNLKFYTYENY